MNQDEKMLYKKNTISYDLVILFTLLNAIHVIFILKTITVDYKIGVYVMLAIIISMVSFLAAVKVQNYSLRWSYVVIFIGIFQACRFGFTPEEITGQLRTNLNIMLGISVISILIGGIISIIKTKRRRYYIKNNYVGREIIK